MKIHTVAVKIAWVLVVCFVSALALSACKSTEEHPSNKSEHPNPGASGDQRACAESVTGEPACESAGG